MSTWNVTNTKPGKGEKITISLLQNLSFRSDCNSGKSIIDL